LHPDKSKISALRDGITFLGYRIFYHYKLLRKRNIRQFSREFQNYLELCKEGFLRPEGIQEQLQGWFGYAQWANTYTLRKRIMAQLKHRESLKDIDSRVLQGFSILDSARQQSCRHAQKPKIVGS